MIKKIALIRPGFYPEGLIIPLDLKNFGKYIVKVVRRYKQHLPLVVFLKLIVSALSVLDPKNPKGPKSIKQIA